MSEHHHPSAPAGGPRRVARRAGLALVVAGACLASGLAVQAGPAAAARALDVTSDTERARVDAVPTPTIAWQPCRTAPQADCAVVRVPRDYDQPTGPTITLALARHRAADPAKKIGTLFVNPGGPGGSGAAMAADARSWATPNILSRFDVVGFDPRGQAGSQRVRCFATLRDQAKVVDPLDATAIPLSGWEQAAHLTAARRLGRSCASAEAKLTDSVSTAEVARDMDVLRRAVGDAKLTYLGFSYGTYLGAVYANLFPDRIRALALDGVVDPLAWQGTPATRHVPVGDRLRSGDGAWSAVREALARCAKAGPDGCRLAGLVKDPEASFRTSMARLKARPISVAIGGGETGLVEYSGVVATLLSTLYDPQAPAFVDELASTLHLAYEGDARQRQEARRSLFWAGWMPDYGVAVPDATAGRVRARTATQDPQTRPASPETESFFSVMCTDGRGPDDPAAAVTLADGVEARAPYFGQLWMWQTSPCAEKTWTSRDEDAWTGGFTARTSAPVLVVGNLWDPATNVAGARTLAGLMPSSRLLVSDSWGHTAYGTSDCATSAVSRYLTTLKLPAEGATCVGDYVPFTPEPEESDRVVPHGSGGRSSAAVRDRDTGGGRAPVVPPAVPGR